MAKQEMWLVTGGLGFIGSHFIRKVLTTRPGVTIFNLDAMTYAANPANLEDIEDLNTYIFVKGDIADPSIVDNLFKKLHFDKVVNFAAQTHVDRSIQDPSPFIHSNITGVSVLLEAARKHKVGLFLQVSTDEVYGNVPTGKSIELDSLHPRSPYAASKAAADLLVGSYSVTYDVPTIITRATNTYGTNQFPEKIIPCFITHLQSGQKVPLHGDGLHIRDWMHVDDHVSGILYAMQYGTIGEIYNVGADNTITNLEITRYILSMANMSDDMIEYVADRAGHDRRYCLDASKLRGLGWSPSRQFSQAFDQTVAWYMHNRDWWATPKEEMDAYRTGLSKV